VDELNAFADARLHEAKHRGGNLWVSSPKAASLHTGDYIPLGGSLACTTWSNKARQKNILR
jgi:hypothetical protein